MPIVYFALAVVVVVTLLPTALRPPPQSPPTAAELSPDAPPDDEQVLISELGRGTTGTAGSGPQLGSSVESAPAAVQFRPSRGRCFGNPPRQVESIYAPPCVSAFTGRNPGATWRGVTANEVRWGLIHARSDAGYEGPVADYREDGDEVVRSWRVWEEYFNRNFELYGRRLRLFLTRTGTNGWQEGPRAREAVRRLVEDYKVMGITSLASSPPAFDEILRRGDVMHIGYGWGRPENYDPMVWSFHVHGPRMIRLVAELVCKQVYNRPVSFSGDAQMNGQPRKLGMLEYRDPNLNIDYGDEFVEATRKQCGWEPAARQAYNLDDDPAGLTTVMTRFRSEGITTIFCLCDPVVTPAVITHAATQQRYFPEWVHGGWLGLERNVNGALFSQEQWRNSIGISAFEMNGARPSGQDWYRSYKEIDPDNAPYTPDWEAYPWHHVLHVAGAIQMAGPVLTPQTMKTGMITRWPGRAPDPNWSLGGGYGPGDFNYSKYVQMMWWDPAAPRPDSTDVGAYRYIYGGKRFAEGELPTDPAPYFKEGITRPPDQERL